jgi:Flp pilus assembly pilin Flp
LTLTDDRLVSWIRPFILRLTTESGQTLAEYGVVIVVIAVVVVIAAFAFGGSVSTLFSSSAHGL